MKVVMEAELLLESKSVSVAVTLALFTSEPGADGITLMVTTAVAPAEMLPSPQVMVVVPLQLPWLGMIAPNAMPDGKVSVRLTLVAVAGPLLVTVSR